MKYDNTQKENNTYGSTSKVIDIHSHVLPGLDDGSKSMEESLEMLQEAEAQGVTAVFATPHYSASGQAATAEQIIAGCRELQKQSEAKNLNHIRIYPGQEIQYSKGTEIVKMLEGGQLLTLADSDCILVEFFPQTVYSEIYDAVRRLSMSSYQLIIAHVERYRALQEAGRAEELIEAGALLQLNYRPIMGSRFAENTRWCRKLLTNGHIHFLGTDMHNMTDRKPQLQEAVKWMERHLDKEYIEDICYKNAEKMILKNNREKE